jgi:hypothetical protein
VKRVLTAEQVSCPFCGATLSVSQHRNRGIRMLDESLDLTMRDKKCTNPQCPAPHLRYRPAEEMGLALLGGEFGLDVVMAIGSMRLRDDFSFPRIHSRLTERGVDIALMSVQYQFRNYLSLVHCQVGLEDGRLRAKLHKQGAILPVIDGIQFGEGDPVLYLVTDILSKRPLFGQQMICRSAKDLVPFISQIKQIGVPILAVVSDKERALVPAIAKALPGVPHQFCQRHYLSNAAKPMDTDLAALGQEVQETEEKLRKFQRTLIHTQKDAQKSGEPLPEDLGVTQELCEAARAEARRSGRAPLEPPAVKRHQGLEKVREAVADARQKKGVLGRTSRSLKKS